MRKMMVGSAALCAVLCIVLSGCGGKVTEETAIPREDVNRQNPIASSVSAVAEGKRLYGATDCAMCHGIQGDGKGVLAKDTPMKTHNWQDASTLAHFTDGELFYIIENGKGRMPGYGKRETPEQVWQMVDYLRSIPSSQPPPKS